MTRSRPFGLAVKAIAVHDLTDRVRPCKSNCRAAVSVFVGLAMARPRARGPRRKVSSMKSKLASGDSPSSSSPLASSAVSTNDRRPKERSEC